MLVTVLARSGTVHSSVDGIGFPYMLHIPPESNSSRDGNRSAMMGYGSMAKERG